jgi:hypothetical protein
MSDKPRYSFGDIDGIMKDGTSVSIGVERDNVVISFDYVDSRDGTLYHVETTGHRTKKELDAKN